MFCCERMLSEQNCVFAKFAQMLCQRKHFQKHKLNLFVIMTPGSERLLMITHGGGSAKRECNSLPRDGDTVDGLPCLPRRLLEDET